MFGSVIETDIKEDLQKRGLLHHQTTLEHEYPFCWRCSLALYLKGGCEVKLARSGMADARAGPLTLVIFSVDGPCSNQLGLMDPLGPQYPNSGRPTSFTRVLRPPPRHFWRENSIAGYPRLWYRRSRKNGCSSPREVTYV